jgi:hypothetical protein
MESDQAVAEWLGDRLQSADDEQVAPRLRADDGRDATVDEDPPWLPILTTDDRSLVHEYMVAARYPRSAADSLDEWPPGELRHLLVNARNWKACVAQRAADHAAAQRQQKELDERRTENRALIERVNRDLSAAILPRERDKSLIVLTAREARRSTTGNHLRGNPGIEFERHLREVAESSGFAAGPPRWDRASKRLFMDLYHRAAEAWWDGGGARGEVPVPPSGKPLESQRRYRALYPFQRAAVNAAHFNRRTDVATTHEDASPARAISGSPGPELESVPSFKEIAPLPQLEAPPEAPQSPAPVTSAPPSTGSTRTSAATEPPPNVKSTSIPNTRKGFKLTLWVSSTSEDGSSDVHGLLQLDGADPVPFCRLVGVANPLARALQEAYMAVERVRAKPPRMSVPTASPAARSTTAHARPPAVLTPAAVSTATQKPSVAAAPNPKPETTQPSLF